MIAHLQLSLHLLAQFMEWSLLSVGSAMGLLPDMHRSLVEVHHWLTDGQFVAAVVIGQSAPGPNMMLFSAVCGWQIDGLTGAVLAPLGLVLPSTLIALGYVRYSAANPDNRWLRALRDGLAPLTVGLMLAAGWMLGQQNIDHGRDLLLLLPALALALRFPRLHPLWLMLAGAVAGVCGWL